MKYEHSSCTWWQLPNRLLEIEQVARRQRHADGSGRDARCDRVHSTVVILRILEARLTPPFALSRVENHVHCHAMKPCSEGALAPKQMQLLPRPNEHILRQLFRAQAIRHHARA